MKKNTQVAVAADASSVLKLMAATFSNANKAVLELVQNGRRAGASRIEIVATETTLTVSDDGSGIDDFGNLLAIAKSGWNEAIQREESPYGAGFISALFAAEHLKVSSRGKTMQGKTADIIERLACPIVNDPKAPKKGTIVKLERPSSRLTFFDLKDTLRGFPIPVVINGEEIERAHAKDDQFQSTEVGDIRLCLNIKYWTAYLQGMRIARFPEGHFYLDRDVTVVHLDPQRFKGRMPDRDNLVDHRSQTQVIATAIQSLAKQQLTKRRGEIPAQEFAEQIELLRDWKCTSLLNDLDVLPSSILTRYARFPIIGRPWDRGTETANDVSRVRGQLPVCVAAGAEETAWVVRTYASALNLPMIDLAALDDGHWAHQDIQIIDLDKSLEGDNILHLEDDAIEVCGEVIASGEMPGLSYSWVNEVRVLKTITLKGPLGEVTLNPTWGLYAQGGTLYITPETSSAVLLQASDYMDDDRFDDDAFEADESVFDQIQRVLVSGDAATLIQSTLLNECPLVHVRGKQFIVTVDEKQAVTVVEMPKAA